MRVTSSPGVDQKGTLADFPQIRHLSDWRQDIEAGIEPGIEPR